MDPTVATGAAAIMAVRVLLDHDVPEENIYLVSLIMARQGMAHVYIHVFACIREYFQPYANLLCACMSICWAGMLYILIVSCQVM